MVKVLIIDEEKKNRAFIAKFLQREFKIKHIAFAEDALSAYNEISRETYDLICLDHHMPFLKSRDFLRELRTKSGMNCETPVIIASASIPELPKDLQASDILFYLDKPIDMARYCRYIRMIFSKAVRETREEFPLLNIDSSL